MHEFVPTYETLYDNEKLGLRHTARSVYIGLCIKARKDRGDRVRLPLGDDLAIGVWRLVGGKLDEVVDALAEELGALRCPSDPAIRVEGETGRLTVVVLAQRAWALGGGEPRPEGTDAAPVDPKTKRRLADAERKRNARRTAKQGADASASDCGQDADTHADASAKRPSDVCGQSADVGGVRGGVSGVQTQKREEEKTPEEKREERAPASHGSGGQDADTHADASAKRPSDTVPIVAADTLLAAVGRHEMLRTLHGDTTWATRALGALQAAACRAGDAAAAVDAFVLDKGPQAPEEGPQLDAYVREHVGKYLKRAKEHGDAARARAARRGAPPGSDPGSSPGSVPPEAAKVLEVFATAWEAKYRREFVRTPDDVRRAADLVALAKTDARAEGGTGSEAIRRRAEKYLGDADPFVADKDHPFALFVSRINQYDPKGATPSGQPSAPLPALTYAPRRPVPLPPPPEIPPEALEAIRALQRGGGPS